MTHLEPNDIIVIARSRVRVAADNIAGTNYQYTLHTSTHHRVADVSVVVGNVITTTVIVIHCCLVLSTGRPAAKIKQWTMSIELNSCTECRNLSRLLAPCWYDT